jgi:hypothetical protein
MNKVKRNKIQDSVNAFCVFARTKCERALTSLLASRNNILLFAVLLALVPAAVFAQTDTTGGSTPAGSGGTAQPPTTVSVPQGLGGIFSCNQGGSNPAMSVGALGATGGVYVPVADASVELNTGTLVYKECVLREVVDAQRIAATAGFTKQGTTQILTGRNGAAQFVVQQLQEVTTVKTNTVVSVLQNDMSSLDPNIQAQVKNAIAQGYSAATYNSATSLTCPYAGATASFTNSNAQFSWNNILAVGSNCDPIFAYMAANELALGAAAQEANCLQNEWQWGGGFYAVTTGSGGPCEQQIVTPSSNVNSSYTQLLQSPYNQLQNANDLGQMVGALFAGISTQVLSGTGGGITGLTQPIGNQPSYLDQAVAQETQNLQSTVANAALVNLDAALQVEQQYFSIMNQIAGALEGTASQLRSSETSCFNRLIPAVQSKASGDGITLSESKIQAATSSLPFSQAMINAPISGGQSIAQLASTTENNIQVSQQAQALINQLIANVSGSSADSQAVAIEQLNSLIANNQLHTQADIQTAQSQLSSVQSAMATIQANVPSFWAGTDPNNTTNNNIPWNGTIGPAQTLSDPGVGWCNITNQTTLNAWEQQLKS